MTAGRTAKAGDAPARTARAPAPPWHALPVEDAFERLASGPEGLDPDEAARRLAEHGPNRLPEEKPKSALRRLLEQFNNLLIYVLLAAAVLSAGLGHMLDMGVILAVVLINAAVGFIQEGRAEKALGALRDLIAPSASVLRQGRRLTLAAAELAPGDLVLLQAGDRVPADLRLARARNLHIDEAILTGESVAVEKAAEPGQADAPLGERAAMAYFGTMVVAGQGAGVAVATGAGTELGRISTLVSGVEMLTTPLLRQMNVFARQLTVAILAGSAAVFAFAVALRGYAWTDAFMAVVALAVAAIPEGLPAVMTITLAIGVQRMARRHAIIRRLPAVETLGSVSIICSDKTGTFTRNEMTVRGIVTALGPHAVSGVGYEPDGAITRETEKVEAKGDPLVLELARAALMCNDAELRQSEGVWIADGDPMEGALVSFAVKAGLDAGKTRQAFPRVDEIPFDAEHRFMATLHGGEAEQTIYVKGAPERVLGMCAKQCTHEGEEPLDLDAWHQAVETLASRGQRVLAFARTTAPADKRRLAFEDVEGGLTLLGLAGLIDPPREEAVAAVKECRAAGIRVKMITGDHALTAGAIAKQLGLENPHRVVTGREVDRASDSALPELAREADVFARTDPEHKLRIVSALQARGAVVAMTGDGVNDAPALRRADVGVAMGRKGTEAAKEAAEMILADDNFASIVAAVREGRTVYDNLKKVIAWTLPTNGGQSIAIVGAILAGVTLPVTPLQILWVNMITAVTLGLTLAFEPPEPDVMRRPPRAPHERFLSGFLMWRIAFVSALFAIGVFGMFFAASARGLSLEDARTVVVNTIVVMQIVYLFSVRYLSLPSLTWTGLLGTRAVLIGVGVVVAAQLMFTYAPVMQALFDTRPVSLIDGAAILAAGLALFAILEIEKLALRRLGAVKGGSG